MLPPKGGTPNFSISEINMDLGLHNKVAFVAAASRGLGRAVAEELAQEGAALVLCARHQASLDETCEAIRRESGAAVLSVAADLTVNADIERAVTEGLQHFGRIDILVTNVGGPPAAVFAE